MVPALPWDGRVSAEDKWHSHRRLPPPQGRFTSLTCVSYLLSLDLTKFIKITGSTVPRQARSSEKAAGCPLPKPLRPHRPGDG